VAVNDFLSQTIRSLRHKAFTLVSERDADGSFSITIKGDGSAPGEVKPTTKPGRKRVSRSRVSEEPTTSTECCQQS